jgi:hypothetical protein
VKGAYAQTEMRAKFLTTRCPEKGNARDFLRGLRLKKEELAQVGVKISDEDYLSTIISSLPDGLSNFASVQMSWTLQSTSQPMDASTLMTMLLQEAERQNLRSQRRKQGAGKGKEDEKGEALVVSANKPRGKRDINGKVLCWNCGGGDHLRNKCTEPKKSTDDTKKAAEKSETKKEGTSATANVAETVSDDEGAWAAEELFVESGGDWFDEICEVEVERMSSLCAVADVDGVESDFEGEMACVSTVDDADELEEETSGEVHVEDLRDVSGEAFVVADDIPAIV